MSLIRFYFRVVCSEPFRLFFPVGILSLLCGILIWVPLAWKSVNYPVALHKYLLLNGFVASFIAGFLMTAVPRFSKTMHARGFEILIFFLLTLGGVFFTSLENPNWVIGVSALQALTILLFLLLRIFKRKENPPYSFIFIFVGLLLWTISALFKIFSDDVIFDRLHYEGAIAAIILGVGGRLIPGILGHIEIVSAQRELYERPVSLLKTVPLHFFCAVFFFIGSYFLTFPKGEFLRAIIVSYIALIFWRLHRLPKDQTALSFSIWISCWLIVFSFIIRALSDESGIHLSHSFFINGIVMLSLLVGTRVIQSHGPKDKRLENWKGLYGITFCLFLAATTRASAYYLPESYLSHLGYSALLLVLGVLVWSLKYIRYVFPITAKKGNKE